ncbi:P27 family phage terminase small subunit [Acidobacteria bacterium AH-259-A15]|nr:P27 family phage terminase small subunit [Acidobacteria bacterium AH-259-A15]
MDQKRHKKPPLKLKVNHLKAATRQWIEDVVSEWALSDHHIRLLILAGEAWDRCQQARRRILKNGLTFNDRFDQPKARPEIAIERDSRIAFARLVRELDLDVEPPRQPGRSPGL